MWHWMKYDFISLCQTQFHVSGKEGTEFWLARDRLLYATYVCNFTVKLNLIKFD